MALGRGLEALLNQNIEKKEIWEEGLREIPPDQISPSSFQPRKIFNEESLNELCESIRVHGILQPVVVRKTPQGYELIAGERRWRSAKRLGLPTVPARVLQIEDGKLLELSLIENIQRADLNPIEKGMGFKNLMDQFKLTQQQVAERVGLERATVANFLRLLELPDEVKEYLSRGQVTMGHARALLALPRREDQLRTAERILREGLSVRETEEIASGGVPGAARKKRGSKSGGTIHRSAETAALEDKLRKALGSKVEIQNGKKRGKILIEFYGNDDFRRIFDKLTK